MNKTNNENLRESLASLMEGRSGEIAQALIDKAAGGDLKAFGAIREIIGDGREEITAVPDDLSVLSIEELRQMREYYRGFAEDLAGGRPVPDVHTEES